MPLSRRVGEFFSKRRKRLLVIVVVMCCFDSRSGTRQGRTDFRVLVLRSIEGQIVVCLSMMSTLTGHSIHSTHGMMSFSIK